MEISFFIVVIYLPEYKKILWQEVLFKNKAHFLDLNNIQKRAGIDPALINWLFLIDEASGYGPIELKKMSL